MEFCLQTCLAHAVGVPLTAEVWKSRGGDFFWSVIQITAQKKAVQIVTQTAQYTDSALSMAVLQKRRGHPQLE